MVNEPELEQLFLNVNEFFGKLKGVEVDLMQAESFFIVNTDVKKNLIGRIMDIPADGKTKVVISNAGTKSGRQRGLQWRWYTEVANAGIGGRHEDTKDGVHLVSKWRWAIPILCRDDPFFADIFTAWREKHGTDEKAMEWFVDVQVHTESMSINQIGEFLTDFQRHYGPLVGLTDPETKGLID